MNDTKKLEPGDTVTLKLERQTIYGSNVPGAGRVTTKRLDVIRVLDNGRVLLRDKRKVRGYGYRRCYTWAVDHGNVLSYDPSPLRYLVVEVD